MVVTFYCETSYNAKIILQVEFGKDSMEQYRAVLWFPGLLAANHIRDDRSKMGITVAASVERQYWAALKGLLNK